YGPRFQLRHRARGTQWAVRPIWSSIPGQLGHAARDVVANLAHLFEAEADRVDNVPVDVTLAWKDRAGIAAAHRHDDVRPGDVLVGDRLRLFVGDVDVDLLHGPDHGLVKLGFWVRARRPGLAAEL